MKVSVFAPASIGNLSVGFDVLGLAVKPIDKTLLGDVVSVERSEQNQLVVVGKFAGKLPNDKEQNIVWQCLLRFNQALKDCGISPVPVVMTLDKKMPVGSGLGSSACSVVAALEALNCFYHKMGIHQFEQAKMIRFMGELEAKISGSLHYDNVAPCYFGGLQLMIPDEQIITRSLPTFDDCFYVMAYPGIEVSTKAAREVLPTEYSRAEVITFGQNLATFVDACHRQDKALAHQVIADVIAEPYRKKLLPGFEAAYEYLKAQGALAVGISGSGPTLFCVVDDLVKAQQYAKWLSDNYLQSNVNGSSEGFVHVCQVDKQGAVALAS